MLTLTSNSGLTVRGVPITSAQCTCANNVLATSHQLYGGTIAATAMLLALIASNALHGNGTAADQAWAREFLQGAPTANLGPVYRTTGAYAEGGAMALVRDGWTNCVNVALQVASGQHDTWPSSWWAPASATHGSAPSGTTQGPTPPPPTPYSMVGPAGSYLQAEATRILTAYGSDVPKGGTAGSGGTGTKPNSTASGQPATGTAISTSAAVAAAKAANTGGVTVGFAVYTASGTEVAQFQATDTNYGGSITKSMLLVAYLRQYTTVSSQATGYLTNMIENSDNGSANWVYNQLASPPLDSTVATPNATANTSVNWVASNSGMTGFSLDTTDGTYVLGQSLVTAHDFARFFSIIDTLIPSAQRSFVTGLMGNIANQAGFLKDNLPGLTYEKEGWKPEGSVWSVNQAVQLSTGGSVYGIAATVQGASTQLSGEAIIQAIGAALSFTASNGGAAAPSSSNNAQFTIGGPNNPSEDVWTGINRLAQEVNWYLFTNGECLYFMDAEEMLAQETTLYIDRLNDPTGRLLHADWSYDNTAYGYVSTHTRKFKVQKQTNLVTSLSPTSCNITYICGIDEVRGGDVVQLVNFGLADGMWIVASVRRSVFKMFSELELVPGFAPITEAQAAGTTGQAAGTTGSQVVTPATGTVAGILAMAKAACGGPYNQFPQHAAAFDESIATVHLKGTDCSGFVSWLFGPLGLNIWSQPYTTPYIPGAPHLSPGVGRQVTIYDNPGFGDAGHVWIDIDGNYFESAGQVGIHQMDNALVQYYLSTKAYTPFHPTGM